MTTKTKLNANRHDKNIGEMTEEHKASAHKIDKRQTSIKLAEGAATTGELGGTFAPNDDQLLKINRFCRIEATADNVVAFQTMSCNDLYDRDDERFTPATINEFAALEPPYSFTGKSFMADHDYQMGKVRGRIFDTGKKTVNGVHFVTNDVYVPKTPQYEAYIENLDFGLAWAVSVGVVIDKSNCSICNAPVYGFSRYSWCAEGHEKGYYYVPGKEEGDGWGYFLPVEPSTKGAVKAMVDLSDPIDCYELSQVFLGAQYMAELAKKPGFRGMVKAASAVPVLGLSEKEKGLIPMPEEHPQLVEARKLYQIESLKDGTLKWVDAQKLVWAFDPEDGSVTSFGKSTDEDDPEETEADKAAEALKTRYEALQARRATFDAPLAEKASEDDSDDDDSSVTLAESLDAIIDEIGDAIDSEEYEQAAALCDSADGVADDLLEALGGTDADEADDGKGAPAPSGEPLFLSVSETLTLARSARIPDDMVAACADLTETKAVIKALFANTSKALRVANKELDELRPKAVLGDSYLKELESEALNWFVKSKIDPKTGKGVATTFAEKMISRCAGDVEMLKELSAEWQAEAERRFPTPRRRSTVPDDKDADPNNPTGPSPLPDEFTGMGVTDPAVKRLHG